MKNEHSMQTNENIVQTSLCILENFDGKMEIIAGWAWQNSFDKEGNSFILYRNREIYNHQDIIN